MIGRRTEGRTWDVVAAHAQVASRTQVLTDRRALYRLALALTGSPAVPDDVLDHPAHRYAIGEVVAGRAPAADLRLRAEPPTDGPRPGVAGRPDSDAVLAPALRSVAAESGGAVALITTADGHRFDDAVGEVRAGLALARQVMPELFADLVGHVGLIGVLDPERSGPVLSASSRDVPGLVLLRPGGPLAVAESIIHEAAHQRLFDLAITRDMLSAASDRHPGFRPSWRTGTWPVEQTLAACHAYACLAEFADAVDGGTPGPHSVLPAATERARELGHWLLDRPDAVGVDAHRLLCALFARPVPTEPPPTRATPGRTYRPAADCSIVPTGDGRCLVGIPSDPPRLFWLDGDAAEVLRILRSGGGQVGASEIAGEFARRTGPAGDAFDRVADALETLVLSELAAVS